MNLRDGLGLGDERDDVIDMATRFFTVCLAFAINLLGLLPLFNSIYILTDGS